MLLSNPMTFQVIGFGVSSTHVCPDGQSAASAHRVATVTLQCPMGGGGMPLMVSDVPVSPLRSVKWYGSNCSRTTDSWLPSTGVGVTLPPPFAGVSSSVSALIEP